MKSQLFGMSNVFWKDPNLYLTLLLIYFHLLLQREKLRNCRGINQWTTGLKLLCTMFSYCEVKRDREGLDRADRQNMYGCSIAVKALLDINQPTRSRVLYGEVLVLFYLS